MTTVSTTSSSNQMSAEMLAAVNPKTKESSAMELTENRFLKLLTAQLKNQDPLNPLDNAQMTSQMAQISTVNGIEKLNSTLEKLMSSSTDSQAVQAAAMLGHAVLAPGNGIELAAGGTGVGGVEFPQAVDSAILTITDANGMTVRQVDLGAQEAGLFNFSWDGKNDAGTLAAAGQYSFSVAAKQAGNSITVTPLEAALVGGVVRDKTGVQLDLGRLGNISLDEIRQII